MIARAINPTRSIRTLSAWTRSTPGWNTACPRQFWNSSIARRTTAPPKDSAPKKSAPTEKKSEGIIMKADEDALVDIDPKEISEASREVLSALEAQQELARIAKSGETIAPGTRPGDVPTDLEHATGVERLELLGKMAGIPFFDTSPLPADRLGTLEEPVQIISHYHERNIGCTGVPADSHEILWYPLRRGKPTRCMECGCVYMMDYRGKENTEQEHAMHH